MFNRVQRTLFGLSPDETSFAKRGFADCEPDVRLRLERIGDTFLHGYHAALEESDLDRLDTRLRQVEDEFCGFAFEGAAMALALLDHLLPWRRDRVVSFLDGPGSDHTYMVHVGAGWALARLPWRTQLPPLRYDPLLRWLALDGYGFHEGYFHWPRYFKQRAMPTGISGYALRAFDQGLGRSLWFVEGADVNRIPHTIATLSSARHADLWSGVGLACAYAGAVDGSDLELLRAAAGPYWPCLAQGVAFAAKTRQRAGNPAPHTDLACHIVCSLPPDSVASIPDIALHNLPSQDPMPHGPTPYGPASNGAMPVYEIWRQRIQAFFVQEEAHV